MVKGTDIIIGPKDYTLMPDLMLLQLAGDGDKDAWREYLRRNPSAKNDTVTPKFAIEDGE